MSQNELMNNKEQRTAPATKGLLNTFVTHPFLPNLVYTTKLLTLNRCHLCHFIGVYVYGSQGTLTHGCLKVHGEVPIVLCIFVDPLYPRIKCLVFRECLVALFLNPES